MAEEQSVPTSGVTLVDRAAEASEPRVLLTRRPDDRSFLGGFYGFFVGRREEGDARVPFAETSRFMAPARAAWGCAVRELFEESGLLPLAQGLVVSWEEEPRVPAPWGSWREFRARVDAGEIVFGEALREAELAVDAGALHPVGEWPAPEWADFETRTEFFVFTPERVPEGVLDRIDDREHAEAHWVRPSEAIRRWREDSWFLSTPIRFVLEGLADRGGVPNDDLLPAPSQRTRPMEELIEVLGGLRMLPLATPTLPPATHTNCYIVGDGPAVVVDPGSDVARERRLLEETVEILDRRAVSPRAIVLTHHHEDHVGGVEALRASFDIDVWAHRETAEHLDAFEVDRELCDGERLELPRHPMRVLHTPGHAPGHVALLHERTGVAIVGDLVASTGTILIDPPEGEMAAYLQSLERMRALEPRALLPAHGDVVTGPAELLGYYISHRHEREEKVLGALKGASGPVGPADLVPEVYDDAPRAAWPLAARSLLAHLIHLSERGEAVREGDRFRAATP